MDLLSYRFDVLLYFFILYGVICLFTNVTLTQKDFNVLRASTFSFVGPLTRSFLFFYASPSYGRLGVFIFLFHFVMVILFSLCDLHFPIRPASTLMATRRMNTCTKCWSSVNLALARLLLSNDTSTSSFRSIIKLQLESILL